MERLIENGKVRFGLFAEPVGLINYADYPLRTPMGRQWPAFLRPLAFNQFCFVGIIAPEIIAGAAIIDLKYLSSAFVYIYDRRSDSFTELEKIRAPLSSNRFISPTPEEVSCKFESGTISVLISGQQLVVRSKDIDIDVRFEKRHEHPLRICTRAGYTGWVYTQKTTPIGVYGEIRAGSAVTTVSSPSAMAMMDWTAGYMRRDTFWNWASTATTLPDGKSLGLNLACGVNETGFTENAFWIDEEMTKVDMVHFDFDSDQPESRWQIRSADGRVNLEFHPEKKRSQKVNAGLIATRFTQFIGRFSGTLIPFKGESIVIDGCTGWVEDHFAKW